MHHLPPNQPGLSPPCPIMQAPTNLCNPWRRLPLPPHPTPGHGVAQSRAPGASSGEVRLLASVDLGVVAIIRSKDEA